MINTEKFSSIITELKTVSFIEKNKQAKKHLKDLREEKTG